MKKVLAVFMAILMAFSALTLVVSAAEPAAEPAAEEETTVIRYPDPEEPSNIVNDEGLVFPSNFNQLKMAFSFKIIERIINFFLSLFGTSLDQGLTHSVSDAGKWLDEAISNINGSLN